MTAGRKRPRSTRRVPRATPRRRRPRRRTPTGFTPGAQLSQPTAVTLPAPEFADVADPRQRAYLVQLTVSNRLDLAAQAAGVSLRTAYSWRANADDVPFREGLTIATALRGDRLEAEAWRRGHDGVVEPVYQGGRLVGTVLRKSDQVLMFLMKAELPHKYRERVEHEHAGPKGGPIPVGHTGTVMLYLPDNRRGATP